MKHITPKTIALAVAIAFALALATSTVILYDKTTKLEKAIKANVELNDALASIVLDMRLVVMTNTIYRNRGTYGEYDRHKDADELAGLSGKYYDKVGEIYERFSKNK